MNREELEELIFDCTYDNFGDFPSYDELVSYVANPPNGEPEIEIDRSMYDNICEDRWMTIYGQGTINEKGYKSKGDYIR